MIDTMSEPAGNKPSEENEKMSAFYRTLTEEQKKESKSFLLNTLEMAIFGPFYFLDGVRAIKSGENKVSLELWYRNGEFTQL